MERLVQATDKLRDRFGFSKVQFGGSLTGKQPRPTRKTELVNESFPAAQDTTRRIFLR